MTKFTGTLWASVLFAILSLSFSSCQKESGNVFTITTADYDAGKAYMGDNHVVYWHDGDELRINGGVYAVSVDASQNSRATIAADGIMPYGDSYYAAYPAGLSQIANNGTVTITLPGEVAYQCDGTVQRVENVMAAHSTGNSLQMHNLCTMLRLQVKTDISGTKLCAIEVSADQDLAGQFSAVPSGDGWSVTTTNSGNMKTRTLIFPTPIELTANTQYFYLPVMPQASVTNFTLRYFIEDINHNVHSIARTRTTATNFTQGHMYGFDEVCLSSTTAPNGYTMTTYNGTQELPYHVFTAECWDYVVPTATTGKYIKLANDITVTSTTETFSANLDGQGHTITLDGNATSLFKTMAANSTVANLTIEKSGTVTTIPTDVESYNNCFGFLAYTAAENTVISNCTSLCSLNVENNNYAKIIGGICGQSKGSVENCTNNGTLSANANRLGGITGIFAGTNMLNCTNNGTIESRGAITNTECYCGGISAEVNSTTAQVTGCVNNAQLILSNSGASANGIYIGGIFGCAKSNINNCHNSGTLTCSETTNIQKYIGGILGFNISSKDYLAVTMLNCSNTGDINHSTQINNYRAAGLVGKVQRMNIDNSFAYCNISSWKAAGIVSVTDLFSDISITNCYYYGTMTVTSTNNNAKGAIVNEKELNTHTASATRCYYPSGLSVVNCTTDNCNALSDQFTLQGGGSLVNALNASGKPVDSFNWIQGSDMVKLSIPEQ